MRRISAAVVAVAVAAATGCGSFAGDEAPDSVGTVRGVPTGEGLKVVLEEVNASGEHGTATIAVLRPHRVQVVIDLLYAREQMAPVHVHDGSCDDPGRVRFVLDGIRDGRSATKLDVPLAEIDSGVIDVHDGGRRVACGEIDGAIRVDRT